MGEESPNVELMRELFERWNAGDRSALEGVLDPEVEINTIRSELEGRPYRGVEGYRKALADYDRDWDEVRFTVHEIRGAGDLVASSVNIRSRGKASGVEVDVPLGFLWEFRDGLVMRMRSYSDPAEALAGLE
jgi:ketosteroid isomerase-like protein